MTQVDELVQFKILILNKKVSWKKFPISAAPTYVSVRQCLENWWEKIIQVIKG